MQEVYWASEAPEKMPALIMERVDQYKKYLEQSGILRELRKSYRTYYGMTEIKQIDQGLQAIHVNEYANLIRHVLVDVTSQRPAWEPRAANTDLETQADTQLASGLLDYTMREKHIEPVLNGAIERACFLREGWVSVGWSVQGGEVHGVNPDDGSEIREGDIEVRSHTLLDTVRDVRRRDMNHDWFIIRDWVNKWDLAAQYPELAEDISALTSDGKEDYQYELVNDEKATAIDIKTDLIPRYTLFHNKTASMPSGRMTVVLSNDIRLFDGPLPYKRAYVFPALAGQKVDAAFGHSNLMDLLPLQDASNATISAILTNQAANAIQNFQVPKGAAPSVTKVMDGLNIWEFDPKAGKLEPMDLLKTAPEVFNFAEMLKSRMELLAGVSQIARGNAPATMSGTAMALLAQQSMEFSSSLQLSRTLLLEAVGTAIIELYQTFAVVPRVAMIVGKSKRPQMRSFKGSDLNGISRVIVDTANPLTKTSAGRVEIANQLLQQGLIKNPQQYIQVLTTGNLEPIYESEQAQLNLMRAENERLMDGQAVVAFLTDDHPIHILEHSAVLNSPESRENPKVVGAVQSHIQEHLNIARGLPPDLAMILKQQSVFQAPAPAPGAPPAGGPGPVMDNQNPVTEEAEQTPLPQPAQPPEINPNGGF